MKRRRSPIGALKHGTVATAALLLAPSLLRAQCAMCNTAAGSSQDVGRGLSWSVLFMLGGLFSIVGWMVVLVVRASRGGGHTPSE